MAELSRLKKTISEAPVIFLANGYKYFVHPITDGIPYISKELLDEVVENIIDIADKGFNRIVTVEAMGIPLATLMTHKTGVPSVIIRKRSYGFPGEYSLTQQTGYSRAPMFINSLEEGDRILFVDDVVSTGGTLVPLMKAFDDMGVEVVDTIIVVNRSNDIRVVEEKIGRRIKFLVKVDMREGRPIVV